MPRKDFEAFTRLDASDVNTFLMDQSVMTFGGTAARGSAIPSPVNGMYTHLEDSPARLQFWNGSAWVSPLGTTLLATQSFTSVSTISVNNVFSSEYDNYKITVNLNSVSNPGINYGLRLRTGGTTNTSSNYRFGAYFIGAEINQSAANNNNTTSTYWTLGNGSVAGATSEITLHRPFLTERTAISALGSGSFLWALGGQTTVTTSYDGFTIFYDGAGTFTGTFSVYGLRK
jgi:hypothetical protein